jgi:hypothetical protein
MTLQANALTSLSRVKLDLDIQTSDTSQNTQLTNYINSASDQIEALCNRRFHSEVYTHRLTGKGDSYLIFEQFPVTVLTSVYNDDLWIYGSLTELTVGSDVAVDKETFLVRRGKCNEWAPAPMSVRATYTAGYSTIPEGLQQACVEYVRYLYLMQSTRRLGTSNRSKLGENVTFNDNIPQMIKFLILPYQRDIAIKRALQLNGLMLFSDDQKSKNKTELLKGS